MADTSASTSAPLPHQEDEWAASDAEPASAPVGMRPHVRSSSWPAAIPDLGLLRTAAAGVSTPLARDVFYQELLARVDPKDIADVRQDFHTLAGALLEAAAVLKLRDPASHLSLTASVSAAAPPLARACAAGGTRA